MRAADLFERARRQPARLCDCHRGISGRALTEHFAKILGDPTVGLYSATDGSKGAALTQTFNDSLADILFGKRPVSDLDSLVRDWRTNGGDTIRSEYEQAFQAARV